MITASRMDGIATSGKSLNIEDTERGNHGPRFDGARFHQLRKSWRNAVRFYSKVAGVSIIFSS